MGFRFRKSINLGGFRINLSKSGIGYSFGVKGFRFTKKAGGGIRTTTSLPGTGLSYTKDFSTGSRGTKKTAHTSSAKENEEFVAFESEIQDSSSNAMIDKINEAEKKNRFYKNLWIILLVIGAICLLIAVALLINGNMLTVQYSTGGEETINTLPLTIILLVLGIAGIGCSFIFNKQFNIELFYDFSDSQANEEAYKKFLQGIGKLQNNEPIWKLVADGNSAETITSIRRLPLKFYKEETEIVTNLPLHDISIHCDNLLFLPDIIGVKQSNVWVGVSYSDCTISFSQVEVGHTWRYPKESNPEEPDRRYKNNVRIPIYHGGIYISSSNGLELNLMCSSLEASKSFVEEFKNYISFSKTGQ